MIVAISDPYRNVLFLPGIHPRKELCERLGSSHADKIYVDKKDGRRVHIGYVVNGLWWTFYRSWEKEE